MELSIEVKKNLNEYLITVIIGLLLLQFLVVFIDENDLLYSLVDAHIYIYSAGVTSVMTRRRQNSLRTFNIHPTVRKGSDILEKTDSVTCGFQF